jgi:O-antigen ligase
VSCELNSRSSLLDLRPELRLLGVLGSFEAVFVLFLLSANYKNDPRLSFVPIDLTVIFLVLGVAMGLAIICREGIYLPGLTLVSLLILFIAWVMLSDLWTPSELYAREKLSKMATLNLWCVIATAMIIANRSERVRRLLVLLLVLGTAASVDGLTQYAGVTTEYIGFTPAPPGALSVNEGFSSDFRLENNLGHARFYSMGALIAFVAWLYTNSLSKRGVVLMAAFVTCFWGLLITGGRGPTLATVASMLLPLVLSLRFADRRLLASKALVASFALVAVLVVALVQGASEYSGNLRTVHRLTVLFTEEGGGGSAAARWERWTGSWQLWLEQPLFGSGVGSWPVRYFNRDDHGYPHNLIVEVLVEFGLVGLLLLASVAIAAARRASVRRLRENPILMCAAMLCISTFLAAMTSSDITGNRNVFAMFGLLVMRPYSRTAHVHRTSRAREPGLSEQPNSDLRRGVPNPDGSRI